LMMSLWDALRMNMMISYQELVRTFLSEKEVSYYKKSLISQEGSIKKGAPGDAPVVAKSALWGVITPCLLHC
ncbi:hypothetical protein, partial [Escherichia coli]|uniref:hypothetical protein n=1 Tax=Escherichia coli TaxID=562 RepID=UPI001F497FFD